MKKGTFKIFITDSWRDHHPEDNDGTTPAMLTDSGDWAVHKEYRSWNVSHAPSGLGIGASLPTRREAIELAEKLEATVARPMDPSGQVLSCNQRDAIMRALHPDRRPTCTEITTERTTHKFYNEARFCIEHDTKWRDGIEGQPEKNLPKG